MKARLDSGGIAVKFHRIGKTVPCAEGQSEDAVGCIELSGFQWRYIKFQSVILLSMAADSTAMGG